jgi:putative transposase
VGLKNKRYLHAAREAGVFFEAQGVCGMEAVYPTDLSDEQWQSISRLIPPAKPGGRPREVNMRQVLNALFYLSRTGCAWRMLPKEYPSKDTVYWYFKTFRENGTWERIHDLVRKRVRVKHGKQQQPSAVILDSQSVKTTEKRGSVTATTRARRSTDASGI